MFRKIVTVVILVPLAIVIIAFAVANRQAVTVSFDPFSATAPAYVTTVPLFALIFVVLIFGAIIGGATAWLRQGKWRRRARRLEADVRELKGEIDDIRRRFGTSAPAPATEASATLIPPPVP